MSNIPTTTGEGLGLLFKNLIDANIPGDLAADIVRDAAHMALVRDEAFSVRGEVNV